MNTVQFLYSIEGINMRKPVLYIFAIALLISQDAHADEMLKNILISEEVQSISEAEVAKNDAMKLLKKDPKKLEIDQSKKSIFKREKPKPVKTEDKNKYGEAPFGLVWGFSVEDTKSSGTVLTESPLKSSPRNYSATLLPKNLPDFSKYVLNFGAYNKLWNITAYGQPINDDESASKALKEYQKFSDLLNVKYGNKKEFYTPKISIVEEMTKVKDAKGKEIEEIKKKEVIEPIGSKTFLQDLKEKKTSLETTFSNNEVGVILILNVDNGGKSSIIIDYRSLTLNKEQEQKILEAI